MDSRCRPRYSRVRLLGRLLLTALLALTLLPALSLPVAAQGADRDADGLFDADETDIYGTDPDNADTDGDGVSDGEEIFLATDPLVADEPTARTDTDGDGLFDEDEAQIYSTDPAMVDSDGDGVGDGEEVFQGTDPTVPETDTEGGTGDDTGGDDTDGDDTDDPDASCLDSEEASFLELLNEARAAQGAPPVQVSGPLTEAAEAHSQDMVDRNFFDHVNPDGEDFEARIQTAGYEAGSAPRFAENMLRPEETGREAFDIWAGSPDHYANMLDPELVAIGIARVEVPDADFWYWTTTHANEFDVAPDC